MTHINIKLMSMLLLQVYVEEGQAVKKGEVLMTVEGMKMEVSKGRGAGEDRFHSTVKPLNKQKAATLSNGSIEFKMVAPSLIGWTLREEDSS